MLLLVSAQIGEPLSKTKIPLPNGSIVEVDGASHDHRVLCEAWAHQGPAKPSQQKKVMTDAVKLFVAGEAIGRSVRRLIAFANPQAVAWLGGRSWMAQALRTMGIETMTVELPKEWSDRVRAAQARQYR
jgi:hypothetical protein